MGLNCSNTQLWPTHFCCSYSHLTGWVMSSLWSQEYKSLSSYHQDDGIIEYPQENTHRYTATTAAFHCIASDTKKTNKSLSWENVFKQHRAYRMSFSGSKGFWILPFTLASRFCVCVFGSDPCWNKTLNNYHVCPRCVLWRHRQRGGNWGERHAAVQGWFSVHWPQQFPPWRAPWGTSWTPHRLVSSTHKLLWGFCLFFNH